MGKIIRRTLIVFLLVALAAGYFQWNAYGQKTELREEALLYFKEEDYSKTIKYLQQALDKKSLFSEKIDHDMKCYMAESYYQLGLYEEAEEIYDQLLKSSQKEKKYYLLKGRCFQAEEKYDEAVKTFEAGYEKTQESEFLKRICDLYMEQGEYDQALVYAEKGIQAGGESKKELMYQKVIIYEKSQDYQAAYDAVSEYCELFPEYKNAEKEMVFLSTRI